VDFRQQATRLKVPAYFLMGRHDGTTSPKLTEEYFTALCAWVGVGYFSEAARSAASEK